MFSTNQIAIVTGASSGLGFFLTEELLRHDISTLMVARSKQRLLKAKEILGNRYKRVPIYSMSVDVKRYEEIKRLYQYINNNKLKVRMLVNNAGIGRFGEVQSYSIDEIEAMVQTNLIGPILMTQTFLSDIIQTSGIICNILSTSAKKIRSNESIYSATKWGLRGFTLALQTEVKSLPVKVVAVYPGGMDTPFWEKNRGYVSSSSHFMKPEHVAKVIVYNILDVRGCQVNEITVNRFFNG